MGPDQDDQLFEALRLEYEQDVLGPKWSALITSIVRERCASPRYPAKWYTTTRAESWSDDDLLELCQDVVADKLLAKGQIHYIAASAVHIGAVRRLLARNVEQVLYDRLARSAVRNLVDRFHAAQGVSLRAEARPLSEEELAAVARHVAGMPRVPHRGTERAPKVFTDEQIVAAGRAIDQLVGTSYISRSDYFEILSRALPTFLAAPQFMTLEGDEGLRDESEVALGLPDRDQTIVETAMRLERRLTETDREVLRNMLRSRDDDAWQTQSKLAAFLGLPNRQAVAHREQVVGLTVREELRDVPEALHAAVIAAVEAGLAGRLIDG